MNEQKNNTKRISVESSKFYFLENIFVYLVNNDKFNDFILFASNGFIEWAV